DLLFYATTAYFPLWWQGYVKLGAVFDKNNNLMQNGDTLIGALSFQEQVIIPVPDSDSLFYLFSIGLFTPYGLYYSIIDISQNSGLGAVVLKNIQINNFKATDCLNAVKHANGRDWWLLFRRSDSVNNSYYKYLITPTGISPPSIQNIGTSTSNNLMHSTFSKIGAKYLIVDTRGLIEIYNFDRCSGILDSVITIEQETIPIPGYIGCAFSSNDRYIYVSTNDTTSRIFQYDLLAPNIATSKDTIAELNYPITTGGTIRLAPDDKIYWSCFFIDTLGGTYPYADSVYNMYNMNLSVINYPDSGGSTCGFSPFSFYLGGNRSYWGLPNNPQYDMPSLSGSPCDSLTGINYITQSTLNAELFVFYNSIWQKLFVNAKKIKGKNCLLQIFDVKGREVFSEKSQRQPPYFTQ